MAETIYDKYKNTYDYTPHTNSNNVQANTLHATNLKFLSGTQTDLNKYFLDSGDTTYSGNAIEGAFYLTSDTHRLYIGRSIQYSAGVTKVVPVPVNEGIQTVANMTALSNIAAHQGEFYYITESNVLAIYSGSNWVQINPDTDTNTDTSVTSASFTSNNTVDGNGNINYLLSIYQTNKDVLTGNTTAINAVTATFSIPASTIAGLVNIGITSSAATNNNAVVALTGTGSNTATFAISGSSGISLGGTANNLVISGTTYGIESAAVSGATATNTANISLKNDITNGLDSVAIKTGANLAIDNSVADEITIKHVTAGAATSAIYGNNTSGTMSEGGTVYIPKFQLDANGHVASATAISVVLPTAEQVNGITADSNGILTITKSGSANQISSTAVLYHTLTVDGTTATYYNQAHLGSFYSASKVDALIENQLRGLNALTYKGTVGAQTSTIQTLPTTNVAVGDTYLVDTGVTSLNYQGDSTAESVRPGDLLIASGDEYKSSAGTTFDTTKTYYTRSGASAPYTYTKVTSPSAGSLSSYYENTGVIQGTITWTRIAAGDIDTQYNLTYNTANNSFSLRDTTNGNDKGTLSFAGAPITTGDSNKINISMTSTSATGAITIKHAESGVITDNAVMSKSIGTATATAQLAASATFKVPYITVDRTGHVTVAGETSFTLPGSNDDKYVLRNAASPTSTTYDTTIHLFKNSDESGTITLVGPTTAVAVTAGTGTDAGKIKISHATITQSNTAPSATIADTATTFTAVTGVTRDSYGHVTGVATTTYTLPNRYSLAGSSTATNSGGYKSVTNTLYQGSNARGTVSYKSSTLDIAAVQTGSAGNYNTTYTVELKWGSF